MGDIEETALEKGALIEQKPSSLTLLKVFSEMELEALKNEEGKSFLKDLKITPEALEEKISPYWRRQWAYRILYSMASASTVLHIVFQINTSNEGIDGCAKAFNPDLNVPPWLSNSLGISTAILSTLLYTLTFSPNKKSLESILKDAYGSSRLTKIMGAYHQLTQRPCQALLAIARTVGHTTVLLSSNLTGSMPQFIDIFDKIKALPLPANWLIMGSILLLGHIYYTKYMTDAYYEGAKFWFDRSQPFLASEIREKNIFVPFEIVLQTASMIGLRTLYYYYLGEATSKAFGFWFPTPMVTALIILHCLNSLYPTIYHRYLDDKIANKSLGQAKQEALQQQVLEKYGRAYLFKTEPTVIMLFVLRALTGGWLGWKAGELISEEQIASILLTICAAVVLMAFLVRAERQRVFHKLIRQEENASKPEENQKTACEAAANGFALLLNGADCFSTTVSTIGSTSRLLGQVSSLFVPLWSAGRALTMFYFNSEKVRKTTQEMVPKQCTSSAVYGHNRFFPEQKELIQNNVGVRIELAARG